MFFVIRSLTHRRIMQNYRKILKTNQLIYLRTFFDLLFYLENYLFKYKMIRKKKWENNSQKPVKEVLC